MISIQCTACGSRYNVRDELAEKIVKCKKCAAAITVPLADVSSSAPRGSDKDTIKYKCPNCSCKLENSGSMGGRLDKCPMCGFNHPVPLTKGQRKAIAAREAAEAEAARAAVVRQQREQTEKPPSQNAVSESQSVRSDDRPPPISLPAKKNKVPQLIVAVIVLLLCGGGVAIYLILGSTNGEAPVPGDRGKIEAGDLESIKDFAVIARKIRMGITEGITFNDFGEKVFSLRDAYAMIDRRKVPESLAQEADESFKECKALREAWRKHIYESDSASLKRVMQAQMNLAGLALSKFLLTYDRIREQI